MKTFARPEVAIPIKCNQHPWERTIVGVFAHPFFVVTDESGKFQIDGVPPGTYTLVAWHERLGEQEVEVTVLPHETHIADFNFKPLEIKAPGPQPAGVIF